MISNMHAVYFTFSIILATMLVGTQGAKAQTAPPTVSRCAPNYGSDLSMQNEALQSFPGFGWDNLVNEPMAAIYDMYSYKLCKLTPDREHVVPDFVDAISVKQSSIDRFASFYSDYDAYKKSTSQSINFAASFSMWGAGISGSYSSENQQTRQSMISNKASLMQTSFKVHSYTLISEPDAPLSPDFKGRILEIADQIRLNKTNLAKYLSQLLVRDFGTHVVTRVKVGAHISQEDYVDSTTASKSSTSLTGYKAAAAAHFLSIFSFKTSISHSVAESTVTSYKQMTKHSVLKSFGGLDIAALTSTTGLISISLANLVALDRSGDPIWYHISEQQLPELPIMLVLQTGKYIQNAVEEYYSKNTVKGCTNPKATNFKYHANVDDGSCSLFFTNYTFGGIYQTCSASVRNDINCAGLTITNSKSGTTACPDDYEPVLLAAEETQRPSQKNICTWVIYDCWQHLWIWPCKRYVCHTAYQFDTSGIHIFWCKASRQIPFENGYMFGGAFMKGELNPFTKRSSCPQHFNEVYLGAGKYEFVLCLSTDYKSAMPNSIPFGGFVSNATNSENKCPAGYSPTLLFYTKAGNSVEFCVRSYTLNLPDVAKVHSPPFMDIPTDTQAFNSIHSYGDGRMWMYNETAKSWWHTQDAQQNATETLQRYLQVMNYTNH